MRGVSPTVEPAEAFPAINISDDRNYKLEFALCAQTLQDAPATLGQFDFSFTV